jgi:hypothetical protein
MNRTIITKKIASRFMQPATSVHLPGWKENICDMAGKSCTMAWAGYQISMMRPMY